MFPFGIKHKNVTFSIGSLALIDKIDARTGILEKILGGLEGRSKSFIPSVKLLITNKLGKSVSINRLLDFTSEEQLKILGSEESISERTLYRTIERLGENYRVILERDSHLIQEQNLVDPTQFVDFSSSYFEGKQCPLGERGYSRDNQPGKLQFMFGISVGLNNVPSMLTIQKGNVQDKTHMRSMIRLYSKILSENSLLVFDCGGNTNDTKKAIRASHFHYLTLKGKKKGPFLKAIAAFPQGHKISCVLNKKTFSCVKIPNGTDEIRYIFFSEALEHEQLITKEKTFAKELKIGEGLSRKVKRGKDLGQYVAPEGWIITRGHLQKILGEILNPYVTGLEGFFILESSIDDDPRKILEAYKDKDKAEKLIRDLKEGAEIRPIRHWSKHAVIGFVLIVFLTKILVSLTQFFAENPVVKNLKVLKNYLMDLTLTIVYPSFGFGVRIISNNSPELQLYLGDFIKKYGSFEPPDCW